MNAADVLPPHDSQAEAGALACILSTTPDEAATWFKELAPEDFYDHRHRVIFDALAKPRDSGGSIDSVVLYGALSDAGKLQEAGGQDYVTRLPDATLSPANWPAWLDRVRDFRQRRTDLAEAARLRERALAGVGVTETKEDLLARLAALPVLDYERERESAAQRLDCRTSILDKLVESKRPKAQQADTELQGRTLQLPDLEPWSDSVDSAEVLNEVADTFRRYVFLPDGAADALALWCAAAHAFDSFVCSPRLNIRSQHKGCGKTTLRDVTAVFVPRPLPAENLSVAVLFRVIESHKPTVLADEADAWLRDNEELRGMLNAGHRRGGVALRCEGDSNQVRAFSVFAPAVLCGIGALPGTLHDRSIVIRLERAKPGELRERFDSRRTERERELARKLARFIADCTARLETCDPVMPAGAFNRVADNWRPLFAVAEMAGNHWPERATTAFATLASNEDFDAHGIGTTLLADIAEIFDRAGADKLKTAEILERLHRIEGREWKEWGKQGKPISDNQLAKQLRRFGISPRTIRVGDDTPRGYALADFKEAFARYLPSYSVPRCNTATTLVNIEDSSVSDSQQPEFVLHPENAVSINKSRACCTVAPSKAETLTEKYPRLVEEIA